MQTGMVVNTGMSLPPWMSRRRRHDARRPGGCGGRGRAGALRRRSGHERQAPRTVAHRHLGGHGHRRHVDERRRRSRGRWRCRPSGRRLRPPRPRAARRPPPTRTAGWWRHRWRAACRRGPVVTSTRVPSGVTTTPIGFSVSGLNGQRCRRPRACAASSTTQRAVLGADVGARSRRAGSRSSAGAGRPGRSATTSSRSVSMTNTCCRTRR